MSSERIGPALPPHLLAKRKRKAEEEAQGASPLPVSPIPQARSTTLTSVAISQQQDETVSKKARVHGPAMPPAPLDQMPLVPANDNVSDSSDDEFGPDLPGQATSSYPARSAFDDIAIQSPSETPMVSRRDDWMTMPPKQDDLAARMDPTKIRAKGFSNGKGAKGEADNTLWTETPEQKRKRLEDAVLGISSSSARGGSATELTADERKKAKEDEEKARKISQYNEKHRSKSLYDQHQGSDKKEKEDDASKRGWDYEKDMAAGSKVGHAQRTEMMKKAADFGSRFSSGKYL
jgi:hypothetical protein